jgi:hypothetical protein
MGRDRQHSVVLHKFLISQMKHEFKVGDHAEWNSEGYVLGKDHEKGHVRREVQDLGGAFAVEGNTNYVTA